MLHNNVDWYNNRDGKDNTRAIATQGDTRANALFMPAQDALCVKRAFQNNFVNNNTKLFFVEQNKTFAQQLQQTIDDNNYNAKVFQQPLHEIIIPSLDYAWFDFNGTITKEIAYWLNNHLTNKITTNAIICFTLESSWRNNTWFKNLRQNIIKNHQSFYRQFRYRHRIENDKLITFPAFVIACLLNQWNIEFTDVIPYRDTVDMIFYRLEIKNKMKPILPNLDFGYMPRNYKPKEPKPEETMTTSQETIQAIVKARLTGNAALKAHATRKKAAYAKQQTKLGKDAVRCLAAIEAHATRIVQKNKK